MTIGVANPMAGYPQPYATWAALRTDTEGQGDPGGANEIADSTAEPATRPYTVDYTA